MQLNDLYNRCKTGCHAERSEALIIHNLLSDDEIDKLLDKLIRKVWKAQGMPDRLSDEVIKYFADELWKALTEGYGNDLTTVELDTAGEEMLQQLQKNVWHFSAAKNYTQLKAMSDALIGPDGTLREFNEFKRVATAINADQNGAWLKAGYNFAVASGQMASRWVDAQENKDLFPNLEYSAIMDGHTTVNCIKLDGVVRPVDDAFWRTWYPPNHWGCRSDVLQNADDTITPMDSITYPEHIPAMFKRNLAADGLVFPEGHPYFKDNPEGVEATANKLMRKYGQ